MPRAFVVRPFQTKLDSGGKQIDFERIHRDLIKPALQLSGVEGDTTGEIVEAGSIHEDMFQMIVEADIVVCDVTIHNANVFYELGVRHALRKKCTVLIKGGPTSDTTPFDVIAQRYLAYDLADPSSSVNALAKAIQSSLTSDRPSDSPIFQMVPMLREADPDRVQVVPPDLREEVQRAGAAGSKGWLQLLADEVRGQRFERAGLKLIGKTQWAVKDYAGARATWERVLDIYPGDVAANLALANIHERLSRLQPTQRGDLLQRSDLAIERVLDAQTATSEERAEALALKGRNQKTHWRLGFVSALTLQQRREGAIGKALISSYESYRNAFTCDLNQFYPGVGALQMGSILLDLSTEPSWGDMFDDDAEAQEYKAELIGAVVELKSAAALATKAALDKDPKNLWAAFSAADILFLSADRDSRVIKAYKDAAARASPFEWDAAKGQLELFVALGFKAERAAAVIESVDKPLPATAPPLPQHVVIFAGHQIDSPTRQQPRFPATKEAAARDLIAAAMKELATGTHEIVGLGSASPGADILWYEACRALGVKATMCLPMPIGDHSRLAFGNRDDWRGRFLDLTGNGSAVLTLSDQPGLPKWLEGRGIDPWARGNDWVMKIALAAEADKVTLLAFWDGTENVPGSAGTAHMVALAREAGEVRIKVIDSRQLLN